MTTDDDGSGETHLEEEALRELRRLDDVLERVLLRRLARPDAELRVGRRDLSEDVLLRQQPRRVHGADLPVRLRERDHRRRTRAQLFENRL